MANDNYIETHRKVTNLIDNRNLQKAFSVMSKHARSFSTPDISDRLSKIEETYKYLIHYMMEGVQDSGRDKMLSGIAAELYHINDSILRDNFMADSPELYYSARRFDKIRRNNLSSLISNVTGCGEKMLLADLTDDSVRYHKEYETALSELFSYIWTMYGASDADYRELANIVSDNTRPFDLRAQILSALLIGNLKYYDRKALATLIDIYDCDSDKKISARALVAIMLIMASYPKRIKNDPLLSDRLILWQDSIINYRRLREVLMNIIKTRDTQRISSKVKDEVLPELMKLKPDILSKLKDVSREADLDMLDVNPEWEEILNKNGLGDKLKELTEMQMEGADVMMIAFSNLKNFPFFNNLSNWFLPFSPKHSEVAIGENGIGAFSEMLDMEGVMCDSDKYSFALSLSRMPETQRNMMTSQMSEQMAQLKEAIAERKQKSTVPGFDLEVTRYVRDLYRFFKLFRKKEEFNDPFRKPIDFTSLPYLNDMLSDIEIVNLVGEFYFKRGYYEEALPMLMISSGNSEDSHLLWEKIGYCHNALNNLPEAVAWYKKAELFNPDSLWLMKKLAVCYRMLGKYQDAAEYYGKALEAEPDNYSLLMSAGHCLLESGDPEGALSKFYHADYVRPDRPSTWRAIGWTALTTGDLAKSEDFLGRIITTGDATANDLINAGHMQYLKGNLKEAANFYKKASMSSDGGFDMVRSTLYADMHVLEKAGADKDVLNLILEKVAYELA